MRYFIRFLKILFGKGIDASPDELVAIFTGQMYPLEQFLAQVADLHARQGNKVEPETIFAAAGGCSMLALSAATHGMTNSSLEIKNLYADVKHGLLEMYKLEAREPIDAQDLRARFENASHKIARAGIENPTRTGRASAWHAARTACLVVDPDEGNLEEVKIALFKELIKRKYDTARGFFETVPHNKVQLP
jgi:hypothetical protein